MKPVSPIIPGVELPETVYAETQPEYQNLPVFRMDDGMVVSRWKLSLRERLRALFYGDVYLLCATFNHPLQPVMLQVEPPMGELRTWC